MRIVAIGAHPDDIEIGCAGTLVKYRKSGHEVFLMVTTKGSRGGTGEVRRKEQEASAARMGATSLFWGEYRDCEIPVNAEVVGGLEKILNEVKPDMIFVNYTEDTHQDHRHLAKCTISATRNMRNLLFYEVPTTVNFNPNIYVDIDTTYLDKVKCLEAHASQLDKTNIQDVSILDIAHASAIFRGAQARVKLAEGFLPLRLFINIE